MPEIVSYQTTPVWFVNTSWQKSMFTTVYYLATAIGWHIKMTSHKNSNASFINNQDRLIWQRSPNLARSSKLVAASNCLYILYEFVKFPIRHLGLAIRNVWRVRRFSPTLKSVSNDHGVFNSTLLEAVGASLLHLFIGTLKSPAPHKGSGKPSVSMFTQ